ncbi:hypothetical protein L1D14_03950 [Vibrio tubiashii]|uniref:hypothetical protein n=1 Tax=Vibrio tubiashii TaxID=29498 RepID=UPI001EFE14D8|nr:hypothetical protein [Vibrio tubiashii]MCG9575384.1 hypothetical protein [Vibrio tubiashii]
MGRSNVEFLSDEFERCDCENVSQLIGELKLFHSASDIFLASAEWFSLRKTGYVDDKTEEIFNELSGFVFGINLPHGEITVYRGCGNGSYLSNGYSWSRSKAVASWFATRDGSKDAVVAKMTISTTRCLGGLSGAEQEVIIHPDNLEPLTLVEFDSSEKPSLLNYLQQNC